MKMLSAASADSIQSVCSAFPLNKSISRNTKHISFFGDFLLAGPVRLIYKLHAGVQNRSRFADRSPLATPPAPSDALLISSTSLLQTLLVPATGAAALDPRGISRPPLGKGGTSSLVLQML